MSTCKSTARSEEAAAAQRNERITETVRHDACWLCLGSTRYDLRLSAARS